MVESLMGDVITVNAGEVHDGLPKSGAARSWRMLYVPAAALDAATEDDVTTRFEFQAPSARDDRMKALFEHADAARGASTDLAFEAALLRLLSAARQARPRARTLQSAPTAIGRARELMDDAPAHAWTLADLAAIAGLSRFQLLRSFACETGLTPHAYLVQRRVRLARDLIGGGAGLADAAMQAGFADQSHMTRAFLRQYGFTPGRFSALGRSH